MRNIEIRDINWLTLFPKINEDEKHWVIRYAEKFSNVPQETLVSYTLYA